MFGISFFSEVLKGLLQILGFMAVSFVIGFILGAWIF
jgi:hypothetical protein